MTVEAARAGYLADNGYVVESGVRGYVYLAGPMRRLPFFNFPAFHEAEKHLTAEGWGVFNPAAYDEHGGFDPSGKSGEENLDDLGFNLREALASDLAFIAQWADAVAVLPGWENSSGAKAEVATALALGLPVFEAESGRVVAELQPPATSGRAPIVLGLHGYPGAGKDTVAEHLVNVHGFVRVSFADPMYEMVSMLDPYIPHGPTGVTRLTNLVDRHGWNVIKYDQRFGFELRRLLQVLGTEIGRNYFGENAWVDIASRKIDAAHSQGRDVVITDVRFPNEAEFVRSSGGVLTEVTRPGHGAVNQHASEQRISCDHQLANDGTLADFADRVNGLLDILGITNDRVAG